MTTKEINRAISQGHTVVLRDDACHAICRDFFGNLVVVSRTQTDEPVRQATLSDKRRAIVFEIQK